MLNTLAEQSRERERKKEGERKRERKRDIDGDTRRRNRRRAREIGRAKVRKKRTADKIGASCKSSYKRVSR